ncbi:Arabinanase/levansucrase/invertase [Mollisia scopiformis]|uniref:Arabinanase/levansucrase/invertase n=1 Tax=Mollisia scopiformis TaxID=149040 RepID=A0A132B8E2_MOLSC|nr:Arabinanase/levansucrase/invertase [Mollisia scopiformis]KUJ08678.1 Arabinanase/levansucrase/invertase [Mollisia scopiformis]
MHLLTFLFGLITSESPSATFTNPVIYEDFADNDVSVGPDGEYYLSASNMHYSPGAPILRSSNLVNWELIGHSVPSLSWSAKYNMTDGTAYTGGTWASTMRYRNSTGLWYWIGCIDFWTTYVYTASVVSGPWALSGTINSCYYDCGLHIDDDDIMYVVHGNTNVNMSQLSTDGFHEVKTQQIYTTPSGYSGVEGNRMYKRNGSYYILDDSPGDAATWIWKSLTPWGPWTSKLLQKAINGPLPDGGSPCQGSLVETSTGNWYFMSFIWAYPAGRMPILAPITWGADDFPILMAVNGSWGASYPNPLPPSPTPSWLRTDTFSEPVLGVDWEWNHNPDPTKYSVNNSLTLSTATVTSNFYLARNTLTHRIHGPFPVGTVHLDFTNMADGDRAGLAAFRDNSSYIGIVRDSGVYTLEMVTGISQNSSANWATISNGSVVASTNISSTKEVWLRTSIDARSSGTKLAEFYYSLDGTNFTQLGGSASLVTDWEYFMGYRYGIFNYATKALGGSVLVKSFTSA